MTLEYVNQPWSSTPLKPLFHRSVSSGGNECTVNVAEYHLSDSVREKQFKGRNAPNYKQVIEFGQTGSRGLYSIDTGNNGNIFQGNYFSQNANHMSGKLHPMMRLGSSLEKVPTKTLTLKPKRDEPKL